MQDEKGLLLARSNQESFLEVVGLEISLRNSKEEVAGKVVGDGTGNVGRGLTVGAQRCSRQKLSLF